MSMWREREIEHFADWQPNASGLFVPPKLRRPRPIAVDLFSGAGGFSLGIIQGGFDVVAACDNDVLSAMTYLTNLGAYPVQMVWIEPGDKDRFEAGVQREYRRLGIADKHGTIKPGKAGDLHTGHVPMSGSNRRPGYGPGVGHFFFGDIRKLDGRVLLSHLGLDVGELDLLVASPPCQGFSTAGKRDVMDPRNSLVFDWARLCVEIMPKTIAMENVEGIASMTTPEGLPVMDVVARILADGGMGGYEALKQSLLTTSGVGFALRGRGKTHREGTKVRQHQEAKLERQAAQASLFGDAA